MKSLMSGLLGLVFLLYSCEKDPETNLLPANALGTLHLSSSKNLIPLEILKPDVHAIFINAEGQEKVLQLQVNQMVRNQSYQGFHYDAEYLEISYSDRDDQTYLPTVSAHADYDDLKNYSETVWVNIQSVYNKGYTPTLILCPDLQCPYLKRTVDDFTLAGHSFQHVFASCAPPSQFNSFSEVYYTLDKGIVGFRGLNGEMWVLERLGE